MRPRLARILIVLSLLFALLQAAAGQKTGSGGVIIDKPRVSEPVQKTRANVRVITKVVEKPVTPLTGRLFVAAEPGAVILIEPLNIRGADAQKGTVPDGQRTFIFNDLKPGSYRVAATLPGFHEVEKSVAIKRNESEDVTLYFEAILYAVVVQSNVDGELKYGKPDEVPKSVTIQNGRTTLHLPAGNYVANVEPAEPVYKASDWQKFSVTGDTTVEFKLKRIEFSKDTLSATWTEPELKNWDVPATWHTNAKTLVVKGAGIGLPRDDGKRYYKDFQLVSDIKLTNGLGAAFALRAQDSRNYYLLEFTGPQADEPLYVRLFYVKDGVENRIQAIQIPNAAAATLKNPQSFTSVVVKVNDNKFTAEIYDNNTATSYPLGVLMDQDRRFAAGGVGVAARQNSESVISRFIVCTECPKD